MKSDINFRGNTPKPLLSFRAKELRGRQTPAEELLWSYLRKRQINGLYFRRQHNIGIYVVDFYCHEKRLIVEVDGDIHLKNEVVLDQTELAVKAIRKAL